MQPTTPFLLASDLDGTLLGDKPGEKLFAQFAASHATTCTLAYITGRYQWSVLELIEAGRLPRPRFICGNVGTEILDLEEASNQIGKAYARLAATDWNLEEIYRLGVGEGVTRQDFGVHQPDFQAGFNWDARPETLLAFKERLARYHGQVYIQASYDTYIDVLPKRAGKGNAVRFLQQQLGLPPLQVVMAGDAGNDRQMFETEFRGIVPANGLDELKVLACQPWHYHSPYPAARGVLDGLHHFGFIPNTPE